MVVAGQQQQQKQDLSSTEFLSMEDIDKRFQKIACVGHGGFGSVFFAKKRSSGREVALKLFRISLDDDEEEEIVDSFLREVNAVLQLDGTNNDDDDNQKQGEISSNIVYFRDFFRGPNFACIVMPYISGGTLSQEIETKTQPYAERRIAYYLLQLSDALAYAHSKGIAHHDVKASNVLIDRNNNTGGGNQLVLSDFGSAVSPTDDEEARHTSFTKLFAAPELQDSYNRDDYTGLQPEKLDAFALGCILFELVCCKRMVDFDGEETLGEFISRHHPQGAEAAVQLPHICLPWLPHSFALSRGSMTTTTTTGNNATTTIGYSYELRCLLKNLLEPESSNRWTPTQLVKSLRQDGSPIVADFCTAAVAPQPGAALTIDNIQLGMFVQRGRDWNDGNADSGPGSVGIVIRLDSDAEYTEVVFSPSRTNNSNQHSPPTKPICCRIGAGNIYELQVGPTPMSDYFCGNGSKEMITEGVIYCQDASNYHIGQIINPNCTVVHCDIQANRIFVVPLERIYIPTREIFLPASPVPSNLPRKPMPVPMTWNLDIGMLPIIDGVERQLVLDLFYSTEGGMDKQRNEIISIHAVQIQALWNAYANRCEDIAIENWSNPNVSQLFHGTGMRNVSPESLLSHSPQTFYQHCRNVVSNTEEKSNWNEINFSSSALFADQFAYESFDARKIVLSRVACGRSKLRGGEELNNFLLSSLNPLEYHSECDARRSDAVSNINNIVSITNQFQFQQAYPEFIITYRNIQRL